MKPIRIHAFNGTHAMLMDDVPVPCPSADEVLIKVHASSLNPVDVKTVEGKRNSIIIFTQNSTNGYRLASQHCRENPGRTDDETILEGCKV